MPAPAAPSSVQPGRALGKYVVKRVLAEGGMATVYEATHAKLGQRVAIKLLARNLTTRPDVVARFEREARAAATIVSPHVVRVIDVDTSDDGRPYIVMEYLEGRDLEDELRARGPLPIGEAVAYILEAAAAVSVAHRAGVVHRDIKPANIFIADERPRKVVKVLDFGISKIDSPQEISATSTQTMLGTPLYMSPEQVRSARDVDGRTDIWSLGVVLYEMLSGQLPFLAEDASGVIAAIVSDPIVPIGQLRQDAPPALAAAVMKALEKDRNQRFRLVDDLAAALLPFAPPWFRPPMRSPDRSVPPPMLPAHLSSSLAESFDNDRTVADPDAAPDALRPEAPPAPPLEPGTRAEISQPSAVARTTAGGDKRKPGSDAARVALAILLGIITASLVVAVYMVVRRNRASATPTDTATATTATTATPTPPPPPPPTPTATDTATATATAPAPATGTVAPAPSASEAPAHHGRGHLSITMSDGWCTVRIDGAERGATPIANFSVSAGRHDVSCTTSSGTKRQRVTVEAGETRRVRFRGP